MSMMGSVCWVLVCCCVLFCVRDLGYVKWFCVYFKVEWNLEEGDICKARVGFVGLDVIVCYFWDRILLWIRTVESYRCEQNYVVVVDILDVLIQECG